MPDALKTVVLGDQAVEVADASAPIIEAFKANAAKALVDAAAQHEAAIAAKDEEIGTLKASLADAKAQIPDAAAISKLVADRAALVGTVSKIAPSVTTDGLTDAEIRKAAVAAKLGDEAVADASDAEISGMFKVIARDAKTDPAVRAMSSPAAPLNDRSSADEAKAERLRLMQDAWKQPINGGVI